MQLSKGKMNLYSLVWKDLWDRKTYHTLLSQLMTFSFSQASFTSVILALSGVEPGRSGV